MKKLTWFLIVFSVIPSFAQNNDSPLPIIPLPQEVKYFGGAFNQFDPKPEIKLFVRDETQHKLSIEQLNRAILSRFGQEPAITKDNEASIRIGIPSENSTFKKICTDKNIFPETRWGNEGYTIVIDDGGILVAANTPAAIFYAVQSLKMLFRGINPDQEIPYLVITDWPSIDLRIIMDDISRGPIPNMEFMKQQIRRFSEMKINAMSFYIEHVVKTKSYPDFAPEDGGITPEEFSELSEYAAQYHMELIGGFQSLGHFEQILKFPQYAYLGETEKMISPVKPEAKEFLKNIYTEMAPAFSSELFRIDCDEAWDLGRSGTGDYVESRGGIGKVYADHVNELNRHLKKLGKRTIIWDDIARDHPDILTSVDRDILMGVWEYSPWESFAKLIDPVKEAGLDFFVTPGIVNSDRIFPDYQVAFPNIRNFVNEGYEKGTKGVMLTIWDYGGFHFFSNDWLGAAYGAEQSWHPNRKEFNEFDHRFNLAIYGDRTGSITKAIRKLNELTKIDPTYEMNHQVMWKKLIPDKGKSHKLSLEDWTEIMEIADHSFKTVKNAVPQVYNHDLQFLEFIIRQYKILGTSRTGLLTAADLYRQASGLQLSSKEKAMEIIRESQDIITGIKKDWTGLKDEFAELWLKENRKHFLENPLALYSSIVEDLEEVRQHLEEGIARLERGSYLREPSEIRLNIHPAEGQFFTFWLLSGPFPNTEKYGREPDYLINEGGEPGIRPFPGMSYISTDQKVYRFSKFNSSYFDRVDLTDYFQDNHKVFGYAYCRLESPVDQTVIASVGSNDGMEIFLNGDRIYEKHVVRNLVPDEDKIKLPLNAGYNHILLKVENWKYDWEFSFRLPEVVIRNHKQKYKIIN